MKIVIVGGHLNPALAVIEALPRDTQFLFIGRRKALEGDGADSLEYKKIIMLGIPFVNLSTGRLQRKFTKYTIPSLFRLPRGFFEATKILLKFKPDVVVCFGGYLQIPVAFAAYLLRIPVIVHEQTMKAGLANKIIALIASAICISWQESAKYFPKAKTILTGIPIRNEFIITEDSPREEKKHPTLFNTPAAGLETTGDGDNSDGIYERIAGFVRSAFFDRKHKIIYITGGSSGAHAINLLVEGFIARLLEKYYVIHQTGDAKKYKDFERLKKIKNNLHEDLQKKYKLVKFVDPEEVANTMAKADLVISRSGINTIAELIYLGKPCLLIPLPHGQTNEQLENAEFVQRLGLGRVLKQEELTVEILYSQIVEFTAKLDEAGKSGEVARNLINHEAAQKIVEAINKIYQKHQ